MNVKRIRLDSGLDLKDSLESLSRDSNINGFILGVVGDLSKATIQCPGNNKASTLNGHLEIISLNGSLSSGSVHLHLSVSDGECHVWGGHLESGSIVHKGADILIGLLQEQSSLAENITTSINNDVASPLQVAVLPNCPWSKRIIRLLSSGEIPYNIISVEEESTFINIKNITGSSTFPQVFIKGKYIGGYDQFLKLYTSGQL
ncbi:MULTISPECIES: PCC domain-containing protein [unclassified Prochlorococcus]|uniref:PCC domain-containing protein n=1 Tax=unclassified Prochlorococcus TaxID=2627481 RepID=UPI000533B986|nr:MULTISPECIES: DUF296 domain-containing protein [unclassified Prochlorococcus]KGG15192.1 hypothetical protein EV06_1060 [Prochlorococcus sp. MIT 0602]KGG17466.1 hypothetical protein EV07_0906 [Prochlorococcus sp. MIT 0603]